MTRARDADGDVRAEERADQPGHRVEPAFEQEVTAIEQVNLGGGDVLAERLRTGRRAMISS